MITFNGKELWSVSEDESGQEKLIVACDTKSWSTNMVTFKGRELWSVSEGE